jgi:hypothetical protein
MQETHPLIKVGIFSKSDKIEAVGYTPGAIST